ncbi:MAG: hypothetical protein ACRDGM_07880, partial [bacterium]
MTAIKNLEKLQRRLTHPDWVSEPAGIFLQTWKAFVRDAAVDNAPEWRGELKRSILGAQDTSRFPLWARVFSDADHA